MLGGLIAGLLAGNVRNNPGVALAFAGGGALAAGALVLLSARQVRYGDQRRGPQGPSIVQGCLITVGGVLLGFFSCLGALSGAMSISGGNAGIGIAVAASVAGYVVALGGVVLAILGIIAWLSRPLENDGTM
jgi:hypothetical protein